ncbi:hypothetical protein BBJ28_00024232, partial [Nothophytophthora sp. Chile5]
LSRDEIMELYEGSRHISVRDRDRNMEPLNDLFSVAHACLFADVVQYMIDRDIEYEPIALVEDVHQAIADVHMSGNMHKEVALDLPKYIEPNPALRPLLERIRSGKKSFLCTNSSFPYINAGLKYMLGDDWQEVRFRSLLDRVGGEYCAVLLSSSFVYQLFDVVIVSARKPKFYTRQRSFRNLDTGNTQVQWHAVRELRQGEVYTQGSLYQLAKLTGWGGNRVLYIGELEDEMRINTLEELMRSIQNELRSEPEAEVWPFFTPSNYEFVSHLVDIHEELQMEMEMLINANFGSVFRADTYPSQFAFFVQRYVDIYSARLENLLEYPSNHTFYPERIGMPHERPATTPRYE